VDAAGRTSGYKSDSNGQPVLSKPDPALLRRLAGETGGSFTAVSSLRTDLEGVARQIDLGARRPMSEVLLTMREERFQLPLGVAVAALGLLLLGVGAGRKRRFPRKVRGAGAAASAALLLFAARGATAQAQAPAVPVSAAPQQPPSPSPSSPSKNSSSSSSSDPAAATPGSPEEPAPLPLSKKIFSSPRSSAKKGQKALDEKKTDEALTHFQEEVALDPKDPTGSYNLGSAQSKAGRASEAIASLEKARKEGRGALAADAAFNEGQALFREKQYEKAAAAFRDALRRRPSDADAAWNYELCVRRAEEQKKQQEQKKDQQKKDEQKDKKNQQGKDEKQKQEPQAGGKDEEKRRQDRDFEQKANMSREKAEQLLSAIERSDLEEQKKKIAEQRSRRKVARDW
jgi:Ca-activated chloride channel homolog